MGSEWEHLNLTAIGLVQHWFSESLAILQKCYEEKVHLSKGTIKVEILSAIPTD